MRRSRTTGRSRTWDLRKARRRRQRDDSVRWHLETLTELMLPLDAPRTIRAKRARRTPPTPLGPIFVTPPPDLARRPSVEIPDSRWLRAVLALAPVGAIGVGVIATVFSLVSNPLEVATALVLPLLTILALVFGERPGPRLVAALLLDLEAMLAGAVSPAGMAFALVLPLVAVGLVQPVLRGRTLLALFWVSAASAILGVAEAVTIGPARSLMPPGSALLTILSFSAVMAFALALHWRTTRHLSITLAAAEGEIAERVATEGRLRETSEILAAILTSSPVATQAFDRDRNVIVWNPASERTFGWTADEVVGRPLPSEMIPAEERASSADRIARTLAGTTTVGERVRRLTKTGDERWVDIYAAPLLGHDGTPMGVAGQMVDVTDRVRMEAQLAQAQKMGAVGLLASGIAHDFNNTLTAAGGYAELIRNQAEGPILDDATTLLAVVDRGRQLTRQLLDFARRSEGTPVAVDVRDVVVGIEPLVRRLIGAGIAVELELPAAPMVTRVQVGQLEQALINLAINARDAMPHGGRLRIGLEAVARGPAGEPGALDDVAIVVEDEGVGIPPEIVASIFEPFFTTKKAGAGTGLGLAMVRGFVETAGGSLGVVSEPGSGTRFTIRLPRILPRA